MKRSSLKTLFILLVIAAAQLSYAQPKDFSNSITVGITTPILDEGAGIHVGVNPAVLFSHRFAFEGQISFMRTKIKSAVASGRMGRINSVNILFGPRLYLISREKPTRLYLNVLLGGNYNREQHERIQFENHQLGFSVGAFLEVHQFLLGLSLDAPENLVVKAGFVF